MKKSLITSVVALAVGLSAFAQTNMVTKLKNGQLIKYSVEEIEEVFFEDYVDESDTPLKFTILTDSTAAVAEDLAYVSLTGVVKIPSKVKIDGKIYKVTSIGEDAFSGCEGLTEIVIPSGVNVIANHAFQDCEALSKIVIPSGVTSIETGVFSGCVNLKSVSIPSTVISIGVYAFQNCSSLVAVEIPTSVTTIEDNAFFRCSGLNSITIPSSVTKIGKGVFTFCTGLTSINVSPDNAAYSSEDGVLYNISKTSLIKFPCNFSGEFTVPSSVTTIEELSFDGCTGITGVQIPSSVTTIGHWTFRNYYCPLNNKSVQQHSHK